MNILFWYLSNQVKGLFNSFAKNHRSPPEAWHHTCRNQSVERSVNLPRTWRRARPSLTRNLQHSSFNSLRHSLEGRVQAPLTFFVSTSVLRTTSPDSKPQNTTTSEPLAPNKVPPCRPSSAQDPVPFIGMPERFQNSCTLTPSSFPRAQRRSSSHLPTRANRHC